MEYHPDLSARDGRTVLQAVLRHRRVDFPAAEAAVCEVLCFPTKYIYKDISNDKNSSTLASTSLMVNIQLIGLHCSIYGLRSSLLAFKTKWRKKGQKTKAQGSTLGICSMLSFRPVGAKAFHSQNLLPVPGAFSATLQSQGVALD